MENFKFAIPCLMGLESLVAGELREMGASDVRAENGRVYFSGDSHILARANICSRYGERVLVVLGQFEAVTFEELFQHVKSIPLEDYIEREGAFPVKGWTLKSQLHSVPDCQSIIKKAIVERLKTVYKTDWFEETGAIYQIQFSIMKDQVTIMLDTSGVGLHKRGYRPSANEAPIKETLAAAMAYLARVNKNSSVYDPFCGSGTILIEAALLAHNIAPGFRRSFAAERFFFVPDQVWREERARARDIIIKSSDFKAYGSDIDENALIKTENNARRAGVRSKIVVKQRDISDFDTVGDRGIVICNPPYGERLLDVREAEKIYRVMGRVFKKKDGFTYNVISPDENFEKLFGRAADKRRKLYNGMINCQYYMYFKR